MIEQLLIPLLLSFFTGLITWFFSRKANKKKLESMGLDNEIKSANYYKDLLDDMSQRLDKAVTALGESEERHRELMKQNLELLQTNSDLVTEIRRFKQLNGKSE